MNREDYTGHRASLVHTDIGIPLGGDGYIDGQSNFYGSDLSFGPAGNVADNVCGLVALNCTIFFLVVLDGLALRTFLEVWE